MQMDQCLVESFLYTCGNMRLDLSRDIVAEKFNLIKTHKYCNKNILPFAR